MLSQKQKRHIEVIRKFQIVLLIVGIFCLIGGVSFALQMYKLNLSLNTNFYSVSISPLYLLSIVVGILILVNWHENRIWLKIVNDLKKEIKDFQQINAYTYNAFGSVRSQRGSINNPYLFTDRRLDTELNLYYYRAELKVIDTFFIKMWMMTEEGYRGKAFLFED